MFDITAAPPLPPYYKISSNQTSNDTSPTNEITITTTSNEECQIVRKEIVITASAPAPLPEIDLDDIRIPEEYKLFRKPLRPVRQAPWQAKWRLTQQRPRDGLRS